MGIISMGNKQKSFIFCKNLQGIYYNHLVCTPFFILFSVNSADVGSSYFFLHRAGHWSGKWCNDSFVPQFYEDMWRTWFREGFRSHTIFPKALIISQMIHHIIRWVGLAGRDDVYNINRDVKWRGQCDSTMSWALNSVGTDYLMNIFLCSLCMVVAKKPELKSYPNIARGATGTWLSE